MSRDYTLYKNGLRYFRDTWDPWKHDFLIWEDSRVKFSLEKVHRDFWLKLTEFHEPFRDGMFNQQNTQLNSKKWVGLYMNTFPKATVGSQYLTLTEIKPNTENAIPPMVFEGWMTHVMVDSLTRGNIKTRFNLFYGKLYQLYFDPACWWWP